MALADFTFDTDIASAATLPSTWYRDPLVLTLEQDRVFARTWQLVGHSEQVRIPGDYFTCTVASSVTLRWISRAPMGVPAAS